MKTDTFPRRSFRTPTPEEFDEIRKLIDDFKLDGLDLDPALFLVALVDGRMAGFSRIREFEDFVEICSLAVLPGFRLTGIGSALVQKLLARESKKPAYLATVIPDYFLRLGFQPVASVPPQLLAKISVCGAMHHTNAVIVMCSTKGMVP